MIDSRGSRVTAILFVVAVLFVVACSGARPTSTPDPEGAAGPMPATTGQASEAPTPTFTPETSVSFSPTRVPDTPTPTFAAPDSIHDQPTATSGSADTASPSSQPTATTEPPPPPDAPQPTPIIIVQIPDIAGVVETVRPAVVSVVAEVEVRDVFGRVSRQPQNGSGVIFDPRGYVLTNNHVVEGAEAVTITLDDGRQIEAEIVGTDDPTDLAVLKIGGEGLTAVPLADPSAVRVGDLVIAIGNALALPGGPTVTFGVVSALDRAFAVRADLQLYGLIQTDASINPGNSGGPLLNLDGEVVGINTAVARGDFSGREVEGIGFAVGMDTAIPVARQIMEQGTVQWPWLGLWLADLDAPTAAELGLSARSGVAVSQIVRDGPAWKGGVRGGDVILSFGGEKVSSVRELIVILRLRHRVGEKVPATVFRDDEDLALEIELGERPNQ